MPVLFALIAIVLSSPIAQAQVPVQRKTCAAAQQEVARSGRYYKIANGRDVVPIYPVYTDPGYCSMYETAYTRRERTLDNPRCLVGYTCMDRDPDDWH